MANFVCLTCGTQFAESKQPPQHCPICEDERQYVGWNGQEWTTVEEMRTSHKNRLETEEFGLIGIRTDPAFAIGERALLLQTPEGNILWDCVTLIDAATVDAVKKLGGLSAIAISHPHYYSAMVEWSQAFGKIPVYLHAADRQWVMRPDPSIVYWEGSHKSLAEGVTLIHCGGHFAGGAVLHWASGANWRGALLTGDIIQVGMDRKSVSFMYSYPNFIPLSPSAVETIVNSLNTHQFDRIYGGFAGRVIASGGRAILERSARRYLSMIQG